MKNEIYTYCELSWKQVLIGYRFGIFPMGITADTIGWYESNPRAIIPIESPKSKLHITRSLSQVLKKNIFSIKVDNAFGKVIRYCAQRENTWINKIIINAYEDLFRRGYAHSVEVWERNKLIGGLYGVAYQSAFFGESMFHKKNNASKVAVVKLFEILKYNNYILLDIQMMTPLFERFGAVNISKAEYQKILNRAMKEKREFNCDFLQG